MDFDEPRLYYTHQQLQRKPQDENAGDARNRANPNDPGKDSADNVNMDAVRRHFREFLSEFLVVSSRR